MVNSYALKTPLRSQKKQDGNCKRYKSSGSMCTAMAKATKLPLDHAQLNNSNCSCLTKPVAGTLGLWGRLQQCSFYNNWPAFGGPWGGDHRASFGTGRGGPIHLLDTAAWSGDGDGFRFHTAPLSRDCMHNMNTWLVLHTLLTNTTYTQNEWVRFTI